MSSFPTNRHSIAAACHLILALTGITSLNTPCAADQPPDNQVTAAFIATQAGINCSPVHNVYSTVLDEFSQQGVLVSWSEWTTYADDLNRCSFEVVHGVYDSEGHRIPKRRERWIYNGEITADIDYNFSLTLGRHKGDGGTVHVDICDGPELLPNLSKFPLNTVLGRTDPRMSIGAAVQDSISIRLGPADAPGIYEVKYTVPKSGQHILLVDSNKGWTQKEHRCVDEHGNLVFLNTAQFVFDEAGCWVPQLIEERRLKKVVVPTKLKDKDGKPRHFNVPAGVHKIQILELKINLRDFPDEQFEIKLPPGAFVWDKRYKIDYRVGAEALIDEELDRAVIDARKRQSSIEDSDLNQALAAHINTSKASDSDGAKARWLKAIIATTLLAAGGAWVFVRQRSTRG